MFRFFSLPLFALFALLLSGCSNSRYVNYFPYHDSRTTKPTIALMPMINSLRYETSRDFSRELTAQMRYEIMDNEQLELIGSQQMDSALIAMGSIDPMGNNISYSKAFAPCEFLVVTELLEHKYLPDEAGKANPLHSVQGHLCNHVLVMKMRIRMIDLRNPTPCVILQEIIEDKYMVGRDAEAIDQALLTGKTTSHKVSPLAIAHRRFIKDCVCHIESIAYAAN